MTNDKVCIACGMPMREIIDFAMQDTSKDYCVHCAREDGTMQSFDEKKQSMIRFAVKSQGLDEHAAEKIALAMMKKLPAWENVIA